MKKTLLNLAMIIGVTALSLFIYDKKFKSKTAYIEIKKVFNGFQMKKELEEKYKLTAKNREKILDSLVFNLTLMSKRLEEQKNTKAGIDKEMAYRFELKRQEYLKTKNQFSQDNTVLSEKYDSQILEQLTQYAIEFGKKNNYDIVFGADGNGNLMYAKEGYNISDEVITYANNKYKGIE